MICGIKDQIMMGLLHVRSTSLSASHSRLLWLSSGAKVSAVGPVDAVVIGVHAAGGKVLADLCALLCWRLYCPG